MQTWLKEGLSIEVHTVDHPCPYFKPGFAKAKETYDRCVDLHARDPEQQAGRAFACRAAIRSTRRARGIWAEIFNKTTAKGELT